MSLTRKVKIGRPERKKLILAAVVMTDKTPAELGEAFTRFLEMERLTVACQGVREPFGGWEHAPVLNFVQCPEEDLLEQVRRLPPVRSGEAPEVIGLR